ncbi:uncharacterized protein PAC_01323 [Phialocephala subalpina]|uniref:Uncharacterized protein n=1 Tax=Phialocephala subalpina TaxID=576137 RepID=A0A1L7WF87_9HELO|nr:uncharacterized protein PAC_01323 [Phialocephala subalpina]
MLYRRVNREYVDANNKHEVVKVKQCSSHAVLVLHANLYLKYIDGILKVEFKLDTTFKPKPVAGPDDLLLMLVQHWARDKSVFPTEDDRHDVATIILFQAYTGGRPAEFVYTSKGKASENPLGEREESNKNAHPRKAAHYDYDDDSDADDDDDDDDEPECDDDSEAGDDPRSDDNILFDSKDDGSVDGAIDENMNGHGRLDSGYNSDKTDVTMTKDTDKCYTTEIDEGRKPLHQNLDIAMPGEFEEAKRNMTFLFRENPLPIFCPISHILARVICDNAILVDGYTSAEPFFATDLGNQNVKAIKVHWKPECLKRLVFRRSVWTTNGWAKSKTKPMPYSKYAFYLNRLKQDAGFEDKLTSYYFRRGYTNAIDVIRHNPFTGVFNEAYNNQSVRFNV